MNYFVKNNLNLYNMDCMELMKKYPDNYFDLAIVDPPYGLGSRLVEGGGKGIMGKYKEEYRLKQWDEEIPSAEYFKQLFRVSKNQIIWGGNYFIDHLYNTRGIICWDKKQMMPSMSRWEMAWSSFDKVAKTYEVRSQEKNRFHPTQKPVKLYSWILNNYAKEGDKILDTHLGSGSIAIACHDLKFNLTGCEIDEEYFSQMCERINIHTSQLQLF